MFVFLVWMIITVHASTLDFSMPTKELSLEISQKKSTKLYISSSKKGAVQA
jgi:hypothetical protein